jgi:hypothetical protein
MVLICSQVAVALRHSTFALRLLTWTVIPEATMARMRKIRLSPQQNRILCVLEEAGAETNRTVVATLRSEGIFDERDFEKDVATLERLGYVQQEADSLVLTKPGYAALSR